MYPIMFVDYVTAFRRGLAASASDGSLSAGDGDSGSALQLAVGPQLPDIAAMPLDSQVIDGSGGGGGGGGGLLDDSFASDSFGGGGAGGEEEEEDAFTRWLIGTSNTNCTQAQRTSGAPLHNALALPKPAKDSERQEHGLPRVNTNKHTN